MTKKKIIILTVIANLLGFLLAILGSTLFMSTIGLFINYAAKSIQMEVIICIITETVS
jgi:hypothetical protein